MTKIEKEKIRDAIVCGEIKLHQLIKQAELIQQEAIELTKNLIENRKQLQELDDSENKK